MIVRLTEKADDEIMGFLLVICEIFGAIYCNPEVRTPVALSTGRGAEQGLKEQDQRAQTVVDNARSTGNTLQPNNTMEADT
jgi:hypothetical protein